MDPGVIILGVVLIVLVAVIGVLTRRAGKAEDKLEARRASRALPEPDEEDEPKGRAEPARWLPCFRRVRAACCLAEHRSVTDFDPRA